MRSIRLPMNPLNFEALTQLARSIIPAAAPQWTDHNTHDPGIMLLELLSWIAEAQMYGISRTRKDERLAFAHLLGLAPRGPQPASGLVWARPDISPAPWVAGHVVLKGTPVTPDLSEPPQYFTIADVELTTARLIAVYTRFHDGRVADWTAANRRDGATFMPFGTEPTPGDRLVLEFEGPLVGNTVGDSVLSLGVQIVNDAPGSENEVRRRSSARRHRLAVVLKTEEGERPARIESDTTDGFLHTGVLLIRIPAGSVGGSAHAELSVRSARGGFMRAPRFQQIAANVLPIEQVTRAREQRQFGTGLPDQMYVLQHKGLMFPFDDRPLEVTVHEDGRSDVWTAVSDFDQSGPDDPHYVVDELAGSLHFGNGVNGRCVVANASIETEYSVCDGAFGNQPPNLTWKVTGISGPFGNNVAAIVGGSDARGLQQLRGLARQRIGTARPIVTSGDLEAAALTFSDLGVTRALELRPRAGCHIRGRRVLLVVGPHDEGNSTRQPESHEFLTEIHSRLATRLALGQALEVIAPRYVAVRIRASIVAAPRIDPEDLRDKVVEELRKRLSIVQNGVGKGWPFGRDLTATAAGGWIRKVEGVGRVGAVALSSDPASASEDRLVLGRTSLPIFDVENSEITIERSTPPAFQPAQSRVKR